MWVENRTVSRLIYNSIYCSATKISLANCPILSKDKILGETSNKQDPRIMQTSWQLQQAQLVLSQSKTRCYRTFYFMPLEFLYLIMIIQSIYWIRLDSHFTVFQRLKY